MNESSTIYAKLEDDHASAAQVLRRLAETDATNTLQRTALLTELKHSLTRHSKAEDEVFYTALLQYDQVHPLIQDSKREHQRIETLLDELEQMNKSDPQWGTRLQALKDTVEHHVYQEEGSVFPKARTIFTTQRAEELGRQFETAKTRVTVTKAEETAESYAPGATAQAREAGERAQHQAQRLAGEAKERGYSLLRDQQHFLATQLGGLAEALRKTTRQLNSQDQGAVAQYTDQAAEGLERVSRSLQDRDLNSLIGQVEDFARRQPAAFIGGAAIVGFLATRFLKSSAARRSPAPPSPGSYPTTTSEKTGPRTYTSPAASAYHPPASTPGSYSSITPSTREGE